MDAEIISSMVGSVVGLKLVDSLGDSIDDCSIGALEVGSSLDVAPIVDVNSSRVWLT